ncbi:MerR family transcriptional regulator [Planctomycetota bacterium]
MLRQMQTCEPPAYMSISEVADALSERIGRRVRPGVIRYLIDSGKVADVARAGGKRVFTDDDVRRIEEVMER